MLEPVQKVLFVFSSILLLLCVFLAVTPGTGKFTLGTSFLVFVVITVVTAVGPSSVRAFVFKHGEVSITRYAPTKDELKDALIASADTLGNTTSNIEKVKSGAEQRSELERSNVDYLVLATDEQRRRNHDTALRYAIMGLSLPSSDKRVKATLIHRVGSIYYDMGNKELAITKYHEAMSLDSQFSWPHANLGIVYVDQGKNEEAIAEYKEAIRLDPNVGVPHYNLGNVYAAQGKKEEALAEYKEAIRLDPNYAPAHYNLGTVYQDQGKNEEAIAAYKEALRLDPNDKRYRNRLDKIEILSN